MRTSLLRPLLVVVFLLAIQVLTTLWNVVGGQSHLDLMAWYWKLGLLAAGSGCVVALMAELGKEVANRSMVVMIAGTLLVVMLIAGAVTYFAHLNEPEDSGDEDDTPAMTTSSRLDDAAIGGVWKSNARYGAVARQPGATTA